MCALQLDRVQHLLQHLNDIESKIQFTVEVASDGKLPYLDVIECLVDGSLKTCIYWKPTHTDRYLDYASYHHLSHKRAVVRTLTHRASSHSSQL